MISQQEMKALEQRNVQELHEIESYIYNRFKAFEKDDFFNKNADWDESRIISYETMVEMVAEIIQQHLWDEELEISDLDKIDQALWDNLIAEFEVPEQSCPHCSNGCNDCLMTSY